MPTATSEVSIPTPPRYAVRLAKHFEHRISVTRDDRTATMQFPNGVCTLEASDETLRIRIEADSSETLARYQEVVGRHLKQVASAETFDIAWSLEDADVGQSQS